MKITAFKGKLLASGFLLLGAWGLWAYSRAPSAPQTATGTSGAQPSAQGAAASVEPTTTTPVTAGSAAPAPKRDAMAQKTADNQTAAAQLQFATRLQGDHLVRYEGGLHNVLGANPVDPSQPKAAQMITLQNRETGQLTYRLSGVRVTLNDPAQGEAFINSNPALARLFVNSQYLEAAVAPDKVAQVLTQLQADGRVLGVDLMRYSPPAKPK